MRREGRRVLLALHFVKKVRSLACVHRWWSAARPLVRLVAYSYLLYTCFLCHGGGGGQMADAPMAGSVKEQ